SPTEAPQACDTVADPHRNPTDETAHSGTLVIRVKGTENSRSAAYMRVSWATEAFPGKCSRGDRPPEKRRLGRVCRSQLRQTTFYALSHDREYRYLTGWVR